jgi:hypothetical protein
MDFKPLKIKENKDLTPEYGKSRPLRHIQKSPAMRGFFCIVSAGAASAQHWLS